jgi:hypothetical protein
VYAALDARDQAHEPAGAPGAVLHVQQRPRQRELRQRALGSPALDAKILDTLKADVLTAEIVEAVVTRTIELARLEPDEHAERRLRLKADAERLAADIQRLTQAIIAGGSLASLVTALKDRERQRADTLARLEHLDGLSRAPERGDGIRDKLRARLTDWQGMLSRQPEIARQILRRLLVGRLVLTPDTEAHTYAVQGRARVMDVCWRG